MTSLPAIAAPLPLPLLRRGKVREVYEVDSERLLLVASDRISAFDVVLDEPIPGKGRVLTQISAWWFNRLAHLGPSHFITASTDEIIAAVPALAPHRADISGRATLVKRTTPIAFECVVRGYLAGGAWSEYRKSGTLAGEALPEGMVESGRFEKPVFSPATKAESGHDENVTFAVVRDALGAELADLLRERSLAIYSTGRDIAAERGIIIADTKFEFGVHDDGTVLLIDEILTPDSSRFWPADSYVPGRSQPSFDKQPIRDWLAGERSAGRWNGDYPGPHLPGEVIAAASERYATAYRLITGSPLPEDV